MVLIGKYKVYFPFIVIYDFGNIISSNHYNTSKIIYDHNRKIIDK